MISLNARVTLLGKGSRNVLPYINSVSVEIFRTSDLKCVWSIEAPLPPGIAVKLLMNPMGFGVPANTMMEAKKEMRVIPDIAKIRKVHGDDVLEISEALANMPPDQVTSLMGSSNPALTLTSGKTAKLEKNMVKIRNRQVYKTKLREFRNDLCGTFGKIIELMMIKLVQDRG